MVGGRSSVADDSLLDPSPEPQGGAQERVTLPVRRVGTPYLLRTLLRPWSNECRGRDRRGLGGLVSRYRSFRGPRSLDGPGTQGWGQVCRPTSETPPILRDFPRDVGDPERRERRGPKEGVEPVLSPYVRGSPGSPGAVGSWWSGQVATSCFGALTPDATPYRRRSVVDARVDSTPEGVADVGNPTSTTFDVPPGRDRGSRGPSSFPRHPRSPSTPGSFPRSGFVGGEASVARRPPPQPTPPPAPAGRCRVPGSAPDSAPVRKAGFVDNGRGGRENRRLEKGVNVGAYQILHASSFTSFRSKGGDRGPFGKHTLRPTPVLDRRALRWKGRRPFCYGSGLYPCRQT